MPSLFITGTDTNVGKTTVTRAILQTLTQHDCQAVGYKPIACGGDDSLPTEQNQVDYASEDNPDVITILDSCPLPVKYREINSYTYSFQHAGFCGIGCGSSYSRRKVK